MKDAVHAALSRAVDSLRSRFALRPFPVRPWEIGDWGNNGELLGYVFDAYWLSKVFPARMRFADALGCAYWLFGLHPVNDFTFVFGTGLPEPKYLYSGILQVRFGSKPASVPGAVVPGISSYSRGYLLDYRDRPQEYRNGEACIYDAAVFLFVMLALKSFGR
ncbi:MAG: hypothetical protein AB1714_05720 [Acidobacteriota bacterium]